ncbi:MAG: hypothetical protein LBP59_06515 [Planctomycetaceae bacterium]|jgi:hypothetical protein|nr:hypothetical protein [Planctomycetaceae bacterium]
MSVAIRRRMAASNNKPTLLPFLAVLLCTMGALIMLLVLIARDVREPDISQKHNAAPNTPQQISHVTPNSQPQNTESELNKLPLPETNNSQNNSPMISVAQVEETLESIKHDAEEVEWMAKQFAESKIELEKQLENGEAYLASVEKQTTQLREEIKRLFDLIKKIEQEKDKPNEIDVKTLEQLLKQKNDDLKNSEKQLTDLQNDLKNKAKSYAITPYNGTNGTFRTPIYVECKNDKVIIQPEGIELTEYDFLAIDRADNPFDSLLRVARQYYAETGQIGRGMEPYPLIIVRPSGIQAFEAAYAAMGNWLKDFGYELVGENWNIEYPQKNNELKNRMEKQLAIARQRLQGYVAVMKAKNELAKSYAAKNLDANNANSNNQFNGTNNPSQSNKENNKKTYAVENGGAQEILKPTEIIAQNNNANLITNSNSIRINTNQNQENIIPETINSGTANSKSFAKINSNPNNVNNETNTQNNNLANDNFTNNNFTNDNFTNGNFRNNNINVTENNTGNTSDNNLNYPYAVNVTPNNPVANNLAPNNPFPNQTDANQTDANQTQTNRLKNPLREFVKVLPPITGTQNATTDSTTNATQNQTQNTTQNLPPSSSSSLQSSSSPNLSSTNSVSQPAPSNVAESAMGIGQPAPLDPPSASGVIEPRAARTFRSPIRRNIKIQVEADKFIIVKQTGFDTPQTIMIQNPMQQSAAILLKTIADFIETWGIAGERFYWQPILKIKIQNGGETKFNELQKLLKENEINMIIEKE